jgi:LacI family transcriptional regulator
VAEAAGVSLQTVSNVINHHPLMRATTHERVLRAIADLDYRPNPFARALRSNRANCLALVLGDPAPHVLEDPAYMGFLSGMLDGARKQGRTLLIDAVGPREARTRVLDLLRGRSVDGVVLYWSSAMPGLRRLAEESQPAERPLVVVEPDQPVSTLHTVASDNRGGAVAATRYLLELGHRSIAFFTSAIAWPATEQRLAGFRAALTAEPRAQGEVWKCPEWTVQSAREVARAALGAGTRPTAVFGANDVLALGTRQAARELGLRVPEELSVVGFDDLSIAALADPPLTTVRRPDVEMGARAAELLGAPPWPPATVVFPTELVVRASTGPPAASGAGQWVR